MPGNVARIIITVDNKGALRAIRDTAKEVDASSVRVEGADARTVESNDLASTSFKRMRDAAIGLAGLLGLGAVAFGLKDVVEAGERWQEQQAALRTALKTTGNYSAATMAMLNKQAEALATHGGFSVAEQLPAITQLISATHSLSAASKLNAAATNLARGAHISYSKAIKMVEGAAIGQGRALQKLVGIVLPVTKNTEGWTAAMKMANPVGYQHAEMLNKLQTAQLLEQAVTKTYGNQTAAYSKTVGGALSNIRNALEIVITRIGVALLPTIAKIAQWFAKMMEAAEKDWPKIKAALETYVVAPLKAVWSFIKSAWPTIRTIISDAFSVVLTVAKWIYHARSTLIALYVAVQAAGAVWLVYQGALKVAAIWTAIMSTDLAGLTVAEWASLGPLGAMSLAWDTLTAAMLANPIGLIVAGIALLVAGFVLAYMKIKWFRDMVNTVFQFILHLIGGVISWLKANWEYAVGMILAGPFGLFVVYVVKHFNQIVNFVASLPGKIANAAKGLWDGLKGGLIDVANWIIGFINSSFGEIHLPFGLGTIHLFTIGKIGMSTASQTMPGTMPGQTPTGSTGASGPVPPGRRRAGNTGAGQSIVLHHTTHLNGRVIAEETVHYIQKRGATR